MFSSFKTNNETRSRKTKTCCYLLLMLQHAMLFYEINTKRSQNIKPHFPAHKYVCFMLYHLCYNCCTFECCAEASCYNRQAAVVYSCFIQHKSKQLLKTLSIFQLLVLLLVLFTVHLIYGIYELACYVTMNVIYKLESSSYQQSILF